MVSKQAHIPEEVSKTDRSGAEKGLRGPFRHIRRQDTFILSSVAEEQESIFTTKKITRFSGPVISFTAGNNPSCALRQHSVFLYV